MIVLGVGAAVASVLIINVAEWADAGALDQLMEVLADGKGYAGRRLERPLGDPRLALGLVLPLRPRQACSPSRSGTRQLVHWGAGCGAVALLQRGGDLAQPGAFLVFALGWAAVVLTTGAAVNLLGVLLGRPQLIAVLAMPTSLL